ncbi:hypothetical protein [Aquimarina sp. 2201CG5-10]|uniref:energy transducer TonB n=1 Tax=Aquimarina callyspongiae TaxID=3098150 RepID=UPI002AB488CE|nr:hypothetical protein [Aquimarina sp. 2201CG5-10]MDY8134809.1 hypothetical protein [Aquimarina sp. 2201CG5-10]
MKLYPLIILIIFLAFNSYSQSNATTVKCKSKTIERVRKYCVCKDIEQYANSKYNIYAISSFAKQGENRIYTRFKITSEGKMVDIQIKGSSPELEKEALRTLESFPDIIPGSIALENNGKTEDTYNVLIKFVVKNQVTNL